MDNNFTGNAKIGISYSREEALRLKNNFIGNGHLILGMIKLGEKGITKILEKNKVKQNALKKDFEKLNKVVWVEEENNTYPSLPLTKNEEKSIRQSVLEARDVKSPFVDSIHIFLGIIKTEEGDLKQIYQKHKIEYLLIKES